jgi:hypothetical protein
VAQIAYEVTKQFHNCRSLKRMEQYNDTRRWRCYEAALLMKKNEIRTDEEAPLTTPVDASVLEYYRASPRGSLQIAKNLLRRVRDSFFRKNMTLMPGVYISTHDKCKQDSKARSHELDDSLVVELGFGHSRYDMNTLEI